MAIIKNRMLFDASSKSKSDHVYVVTELPEIVGNQVTVSINLDAEAAVLDRYATQYPGQITVDEIRNGDGTRWLLSGGTLITDHEKRIAVGLRDANAADPFAFTNIGAGRCDQKLREHCEEEMASELVLCVKNELGQWRQVNLGSHTQRLSDLNKPAVGRYVNEILSSNSSIKFVPVPEMEMYPLKPHLSKTIIVNWYDVDHHLHYQEKLKGYVLVDIRNKTTEFRRAVSIDLSSYSETKIFFGEGTGYAEWMSLEQLSQLIEAEKICGRNLVTPFLRAL